MGIFSSKKQSKTQLVIDVQEESIAVAVVVASSHEAPLVVYAERDYFDPQEDVVDVVFVTQRMVEKILARAVKQTALQIDSVTCFVHPVWYETHIRHVRFARESKFTITADMVQTLRVKEMDLLTNKDLPEHHEIFASQITDVLINGYSVAPPYKKTRALSVEIYMVAYSIPRQIKKMIEDSIARHFTYSVEYVPFSSAIYTTIRDLFSHNESVIVGTISPQLTELLHVNQKTIVRTGNLAVGRHSIIKDLSLELRQPVEKTIALLNLYDRNHLDELSADDISYGLQVLKDRYLKKYIELFHLLAGDTILPSYLVLATSSLLDTWFKDIIAEALAAAKHTNSNQIHAILITPHLLHEYCEYSFSSKKDPYLMMEAMYINRFT